MNEKRKNILVTVVMAVLLFSLAIGCMFRTPDAYSDSERRTLAGRPALSVDSLLSTEFMSDFEEYTLDQFPLRDVFRSVKAMTELGVFRKADNNGIYTADGHLAKLEYPMNPAMLDNAADKFRYLYEQYIEGKDMKVYFSIIPDKNRFLAADNGYLSLDYDALTVYMQERTDYMEYVDISDLLSADDYYHTDTHWRQERILDVAERLAGAMGVTLGTEYTEHTLDAPFYGVYYGQSALPAEPDTLRYLTGAVLDGCVVTSYDTGKPVQKYMYDMEAAYGKDPYEMFTSGSDALITIENPNADTDRELILFRDSFASSLAPLLVEGYAKITMVDIRYVQSGMLGGLIEFRDQDVLFLYSTLLLNSSLGMK